MVVELLWNWSSDFSQVVDPITGGLTAELYIFLPLIVPIATLLVLSAIGGNPRGQCIYVLGFGPTIIYTLLVLISVGLLDVITSAPISGKVAAYLIALPQFPAALAVAGISIWRDWDARTSLRRAVCAALFVILIFGTEYSMHFQKNF